MQSIIDWRTLTTYRRTRKRGFRVGRKFRRKRVTTLPGLSIVLNRVHRGEQ